MKKLLSVLLALVMLVSVISVPAFAEGETLSVVYHYRDATTREWTPQEETNGVVVGGTFAVNFRAPNTSEEYFTGWYLDEDCTGEPVASITVEDGVNHLYAGYEKFKTVMQGVPYASATTQMVYPAMDAGGVYHATPLPMNTSYANIHTGVDEDGTVYWLRSTANGKNSSQSFPILDENGVAYQFREGSTYKISFKMKNFGVNGAYGGGRTLFGLGKNAASLKAGGAWEGDNKGAGSRSPKVQLQLASATQTRGYTTWKELSGHVTATSLAEGDHPLFFLYIESIETNAELAFKDIVIEEVSVEYYVDDKLIKANYGIAKGTAVELINLEDYYVIPEGKEFSGWYLDKECTQAATALTATGAVKLYAKVGDKPKAKYIANGVEIESLTENLTVGRTYTPKNINLNDAEYAEYIPDGYYFTGWYTDVECTVPVKVEDLTKEVTVAGDIVRYAGLSEYEKEFSPWAFNDTNRPSTVQRLGANFSVLQYPMVHAVDENTSVFTNYIPSNGENWSVNVTTQGEDTIYSYSIDNIGVFVFHDENGKVFKAKPGASYEITYEYLFTNPDTTHDVFPNIGYPVSYITTDTTNWRSVQGYRLSGSNVHSYGSSRGPDMDVTATNANEWGKYTATLVTPDNAAYEPFFYIRNNYGDHGNTGSSVQIKNIKVKMVTAKVNLYVDGVFDKTVEVNPGKFIPEVTPEAPEGKYFTGWYTDADCTVAMPAEGIDAVAGETKDLYAGFETYKTVKYYVGNEVVNTVGNLKVGDTYVVDYEPDAIEDMLFKGWYTEEAFDNVVTSIDIAGDVNLYAKFAEPFGLTYVYKNADGSEAKEAVEGVQVGDAYPIDFLAPNTNTQYFVGWYLDSNYATEATAKVTLANDEAYKLYAKYVDYPTSVDLILPGNGTKETTVHMPVITNPAYGAKVSEYYTKIDSATTWITSSTYNAVTNTTAFVANGDNAYSAHILTDAAGTFVAAKPGKTYKMTFEAKSGNGATLVQLGVGIPKTVIYRTTWATNWWNNGYHEMNYKSNAVTVTAVNDFATYTATVIVPADYPDTAYNFIGLRILDAGENGTLDIRNIKVEECETPNTTGEHSEQIGGVVYEVGAVEDLETYKVDFAYEGSATSFGFFTADKESAGVYSSVNKVEGGKAVITATGDGTYTAFLTVDKLFEGGVAQGETLYMYAIGETESTGEITDVTATKLANALTNDGASALGGNPEEQAIRYYFAYNTVGGSEIILGGKEYQVVKRGFLLANGAVQTNDNGAYVGSGLLDKSVSGAALSNCWKATENGDGTYRIQFSSYVRGFEPQDAKLLFVKGYVTFTDGTNVFTIYAPATNSSVQEILETYPTH